MPTFYVDHGAYSAQGDLGANPTTFGVPQEGDGSTKDAATVAPVASFDVSGITADATDTITIAGAVLTCVASGATTNQFNAATGATLATNIVNAINAATATVNTGTARSTAANNSNQLRNMVFARVTSSTVVEIMFRYGSTALNHANNSNVAVATSGLSSAPTITQFAGGTSGCWGWLGNVSAIGVSSSIALSTYGLLCNADTVCKSGTSSTYVRTVNDLVWCRSGSGKTLNFTNGTRGRLNSSAGPLNILVDSNTIWTGDSGTGVVAINVAVGGSTAVWQAINGSHDTSHAAIMPRGLKYAFTGTSGNATFASYGNQSWYRTKNVEWADEQTANTGYAGFHQLDAGSTNCVLHHENPYYKYSTARSTFSGVANVGGGSEVDFTLVNPTFDYNYSGVPAPGALFRGTSGSGTYRIKIYGGRTTGFGSNLPTVASGATWPAIQMICEGMSGISLPASYIGVQDAIFGGQDQNRRTFQLYSADAGRAMRYEATSGVADWIPSDSPLRPTLGAQTIDGTAWSLRLVWLQSTGQSYGRGFRAPRLTQVCRVTPAGARTVTVQMFIPTAVVPDDANFTALLRYIDNSGISRAEVLGGSALQSSASSWTNAGSWSGHAAKKLVFTTAQSVKPDTEMILELAIFGNSPSGVLESLFVDPEFSIA